MFGVFSVVAAMMFMGCGPTAGGGNNDNNGGGGGGGGGGSLTQAQYVEKAGEGFAKALCRSVFECPEQSAELLFIAGRYPNQEACAAGVISDLGGDLFGEESAGADAGRTEYDAAAASSCIAAIDSLLSGDACLVTIQDSPNEACDRVFVGKVEAGGNCVSGDECSGDLGCVFETNDCFGVCTADLCDGAECGEGEFCDFSSSEGESCVPKLKAGDACTFSDDCTLEADDVECLANGPQTSDGVCTKYGTIAEGDFCDSDSDFCTSGLQCDFDSDECTSSGSGLTLGGSGDVCDLENTPCGPGFVCTDLDFVTGDGTCGTPRKAGEECYIQFECEPSLTCVGTDFMVNPPQAGSCGARLANGQACEDDTDCQSNNCDGTCTDEELCVVP